MLESEWWTAPTKVPNDTGGSVAASFFSSSGGLRETAEYFFMVQISDIAHRNVEHNIHSGRFYNAHHRPLSTVQQYKRADGFFS